MYIHVVSNGDKQLARIWFRAPLHGKTRARPESGILSLSGIALSIMGKCATIGCYHPITSRISPSIAFARPGNLQYGSLRGPRHGGNARYWTTRVKMPAHLWALQKAWLPDDSCHLLGTRIQVPTGVAPNSRRLD